MTEFRPPRAYELCQLRQIWKEAFGDGDAFLDIFYTTAYAPVRCRAAVENDRITAMLYWFDCELSGQKIAYIYGVATAPAHQGRGIATGLMEDTHRHLAALGYAAAILVPGTASLFRFYEKMGYRTQGYVNQSQITAGASLPIRQIDAGQYGVLRRKLLPSNGVVQDAVSLNFLAAMARLYAGDGFLAAVSRGPEPTILEFLGSVDAAPGLLAALGVPGAFCRTPGMDKPFAMILPLGEASLPKPFYFGLAFD